MGGGSVWLAAQLDGSNFLNQSVGNLSSNDTTSLIGLGATVSGQDISTALTVHSGYFAGQILDGTQPGSGKGGSLIKDGTGIFTLANDNSAVAKGGGGYSLGTTVKQGTLLVTNTTGSGTSTGAVTVQSGGVLGGTGIIAPTGTNNVVVQAGGKVDLTADDPAHIPAAFTNTLTFHLASTNRATFQAGATFAFDLGAGGTSDEIAFTGLTGGTSQVFFNNNQLTFNMLAGAGAGTYTLFTFDKSGGYFGTLQNGANYTIGYGANDITVTIAPEPSVWSMLVGGILALFVLRRRNSRMNRQA
jgi:hypothetical protein